MTRIYSREEIQDEFRDARSQIERLTGLQLHLSELVRLRQIVEECMSPDAATIDGGCRIAAIEEAPNRFLYEFYGIDETIYFERLFEIGDEPANKIIIYTRKNIGPKQPVKEWFKMKQEEMFLL